MAGNSYLQASLSEIELDKWLPKEYSEIVMTYNKKDSENIQDCINESRERYGTIDVNEIRKDVIEKFKDGNLDWQVEVYGTSYHSGSSFLVSMP